MSDSYAYKVGLVRIQADAEPPIYLTNADQNLTIGSNVYMSSPEMDLTQLPTKSGAATSQEGRIENISTLAASLTNIAGGYPYNQITVAVSEVELDDDLNVVSTREHFNGLVYQAENKMHNGVVDLVIKDWKYYLDIPGGVSCTEDCYVKYFGDAMCQAIVQQFPVVADIIDGHSVQLASVPAVVDFFFNKGYFELNGTTIKIKYWESGLIFQTTEAMPASWLGQTMAVVAGCDKKLATCRDIHNNEINFSGWGYSMVDYNPQFEEPSK